MKEKLLNLLNVKSIVTVLATLAFVTMIVAGIFFPVAIPQEFMMIYTTIVAFYFGTQHEKGSIDNGKTTDISTTDSSLQ